MSCTSTIPTTGVCKRGGRTRPTDHVYPDGALAAADDGDGETLYVVGNLYGNTEALRALAALVAEEPAGARVIFGGDFHWFDVDDEEFAEIAAGVSASEAITGNVERELARESADFGCGCAYPDSVATGVAERSDQIIRQLRATATRFDGHRAWLASLPMYRAVRIAGERVLVVHGDTHSLSGWRFAADAVRTARDAELAAEFRRTDARVIACSHTCLPCARRVAATQGDCLLINNGAAGMPNFHDRLCGVITRIDAGREVPEGSLYGTQLGALRCDAVALDYNVEAWWRRFRRQWSVGSPADLSYACRLLRGDGGLRASLA